MSLPCLSADFCPWNGAISPPNGKGEMEVEAVPNGARDIPATPKGRKGRLIPERDQEEGGPKQTWAQVASTNKVEEGEG